MWKANKINWKFRKRENRLKLEHNRDCKLEVLINSEWKNMHNLMAETMSDTKASHKWSTDTILSTKSNHLLPIITKKRYIMEDISFGNIIYKNCLFMYGKDNKDELIVIIWEVTILGALRCGLQQKDVKLFKKKARNIMTLKIKDILIENKIEIYKLD